MHRLRPVRARLPSLGPTGACSVLIWTPASRSGATGAEKPRVKSRVDLGDIIPRDGLPHELGDFKINPLAVELVAPMQHS
jgi:hypothetical protein